MSKRPETIGILAYGSLSRDPGGELGPLVVEKIEGVETPVWVEFARQSRTRDGAPTLAPVSEGGATVNASILVLRASVSEFEATDVLWRRETRREGSGEGYELPEGSGSGEVTIRRLKDFEGLDVVLYVEVRANILEPEPRKLAELSIGSARSEAGRSGRDGINYLTDVKKNGVKTPLMPEYEREILRLTDAENLEEAHVKLTTQEP